MGWSTTAGDMRPAHFLGMHAMQGLPLLVALLGRRRSRAESNIRATGLGWLGVSLALAAKALLCLPVTRWAWQISAVVLAASLLAFALHRKPQARLAGSVR